MVDGYKNVGEGANGLSAGKMGSGYIGWNGGGDGDCVEDGG